MQFSDLKNKIANGEDSKVEFKSAGFHNDSLAKEIVAFANMSGGDIFIGVEDSGVITGIPNSKIGEKIINISRNNIIPSLIPELAVVSCDAHKVLRIKVDKGKYKPYKVRTTNKYYIRAGSVSIEPTTEELSRLFQNGSQLHIEVSSIHGTSEKDLDVLKLRLYCNRYRDIEFDEDEIDKLCYNLQLMDENGHLTIVGLLFFGNHITRFLPQAGIELNCFKGQDVTSEILDYKAEESDIPFMVNAAIKFVKLNSRVRPKFDQSELIRNDQPDYEPFALRELIVNAFMHRDWSVFGQKIRINLFSDRLEVFSPGRLPNTLTLQRALFGISYYRNPIIAQMLKDYKLADKVGRGLQKILKYYRSNDLKMPEFESQPEYFRAILYNANNTFGYQLKAGQM